MNFKMFFLLLFLVVSSCNRQEYDPNFYEEFDIPETSGKEVFDGDPEPKRPPIEEAMKGVFGVDSDNDGVRDDVEIWINRHFDDPLKRKAYKEHFRFHALKIIYTESKERQKLEGIVDEHRVFYSSCIYPLYRRKNIHQEEQDGKTFHSVLFNTDPRLKAYGQYIHYNKNIIGTLVPEDNYKYIKNKCPFSKEIRNELAEKYRKVRSL